MPRIALIHAVEAAIEPIRRSFARSWPEARTVNLLDDSLSRDLAAAGRLTADFDRRMTALVDYVLAGGADAVLFTCSAFGRAIEAAGRGRPVPVLKPDEAMIADALAAGPRIGALVAFPPTVDSLRRELDNAAAGLDVAPDVDIRLIEGAAEAMRTGDAARHDDLVVRAAADMAGRDAVMLAQFSMAHLAGPVEAACRTRVLTAPDAAVARLRKLLAAG